MEEPDGDEDVNSALNGFLNSLCPVIKSTFKTELFLHLLGGSV
jgi:hypothetical protein